MLNGVDIEKPRSQEDRLGDLIGVLEELRDAITEKSAIINVKVPPQASVSLPRPEIKLGDTIVQPAKITLPNRPPIDVEVHFKRDNNDFIVSPIRIKEVRE
jgi:hypothetical protein